MREKLGLLRKSLKQTLTGTSITVSWRTLEQRAGLGIQKQESEDQGTLKPPSWPHHYKGPWDIIILTL